MKNLLVEVRAIRRCEGGHTCNLVANGRKVAFIAPGIFEWTNYSARTDVVNWFAARKKLKVAELKPKELKDGWEQKEPDYKNEARDERVEALLLEWIKLHFIAYEVTQACKHSVLTVGHRGELLDWQISPKNLKDASFRQAAMSRFSSKILNGQTLDQVVKLIEKRQEAKLSTDLVKV